MQQPLRVSSSLATGADKTNGAGYREIFHLDF